MPTAIIHVGNNTKVSFSIQFGLFNIKPNKDYSLLVNATSEDGERLVPTSSSIKVNPNTAMRAMGLSKDVVDNPRFVFSVQSSFEVTEDFRHPLSEATVFKITLQLLARDKTLDSIDTYLTLSSKKGGVPAWIIRNLT
ncbi:hypothetical protein [Lactiplantibacillus plantarum]|uniref:hypothetical protein n=1 Tax=Lactiplantibacillus plantarum TaxID=1590 RepID=UPI000BE41420|nr:hypothetical protein [Lactiplantibacillus plantarum]